MGSRVEGLLIDIDNTIYPYEPAHQTALKAALDQLAEISGVNVQLLEKGYYRAKEMVHCRLADTGSSHNRLLYFQRMCEDLGLPSVPTACHLRDAYWDQFFQAMRLDEGVIEFLESLGSTPICWITDFTAEVQFRKISRLGLDRFARYVVTSEEAGVEKPHPRLFRLALSKLGLAPESVCAIGDSYDKDILGAMSLGMSAIWLNRGGIVRNGRKGLLEIGSFVELNKRAWKNE